MELFNFWPQCCDAIQYQQLGADCAINSDCYDRLRPMGAALWFSIPYRLGLSPELLIWIHFLLLGISASLSVQVFSELHLRAFARSPELNKLQLFVISLVSITVHLIFFLPVLFHSLVDSPAGLLALCGFWLLWLDHPRRSKGWIYALAGICIGLAAWLRIFYLYPLLLVMTFYVFRQVVNANNHERERYFIILALLPLSIQYLNTYYETGDFSYVSKYESNEWKASHLSDRAIGYDTVLPAKAIPPDAYRWYSDCSINYSGIVGAWQQGALSDALCIVLHKANFYFGSYMPHTYMAYPSEFLSSSNQGNLLLFGQQFNKPPIWWAHNLSIKMDAASSPIKQMDRTAERIEVIEEKPGGSGAIFQGYSPHQTGMYTFSVWLWTSDLNSKTISLAVLKNPDDTLIRQEVFELSGSPTRYHVTAEMIQGNRYKLLIGAVDGYPVSMGTESGDFFYAWGAQLDAAPHPLDNVMEVDPGQQRLWSKVLLGMNIFASVIALITCLVCVRYKIWGAVASFVFLGAIMAQALFVVPEQRFLVVLHTVIWITALAAIAFMLTKYLREKT